MAESTFVQTNFSSGELTPRVLGRTDLQKYPNGVAVLENFVVQKHGGIIRRSGTKFIAEVETSSEKTRLIPFTFSLDQTYMLEFGNLYIRFYRNSSQLVQVTGDPSVGDVTQKTSPWTTSDLPNLKFTQSADILYISHPDFETRELRRTVGNDTDPANWPLALFAATDGPWLATNTTSGRLAPSATAGSSITITGSDGAAPFVSSDAATSSRTGRLVRLRHAGSIWGYAEITAFTSSSVVTATVRENFSATTATLDWRLGAWSDSTGWPQTSTFHQLRLWFGAAFNSSATTGTAGQPQTLWGSVPGDFTNFEPDDNTGNVQDDSAVTRTLDDDRVNTIRWLKSESSGLIVLTDGGPFLGRGTGEFTPITPKDFVIVRQGPDGADATVRPHQVRNVLLFIKRGALKVLEFIFDFNSNSFIFPEVSLLSEHITVGGVTDSAYQTEPDDILWLARTDGQLISMTYEREENVIAWARHVLGGSFDGSPQPVVESIAVIREGDNDQLWMIVKRTIGGATKRYIEILQPFFAIGADLEDAFFVDSGVSYDATATGTFTGLGHLEGETVQILIDGAAHPDRVVSGGLVLLEGDITAAKASIGLKYTSTVTTMPVVFASPRFDSRGKLSRIYRAFFRLHQTLGGRAGSDGTLDLFDYRDPADPMGSPPPLFTGRQDIVIPQSHDRDVDVTVVQDSPLPMTVLSIDIEGTVGGV